MTGAVPVQVPVPAVSVSATSASPVMAGGIVSAGGEATTASVGSATGPATVPPSLVAVTTTVMAWPMSPGPGV